MRGAGMAAKNVSYILCDGEGAFLLDVEVGGRYFSTRVDASFCYVGKIGGMGMRDIVLCVYFDVFLGGSCFCLCPNRCEKPSIFSFGESHVHAKLSNQPRGCFEAVLSSCFLFLHNIKA